MCMNASSILVMLMLCACAPAQAGDAADVLRRCREACANVSDCVTLERKEGSWRVSEVSLVSERKEVTDSDLQPLTGLGTLDSLHISTVWGGGGRITEEGIKKLAAFQNLRRLALRCGLPNTALASIGSLQELEELNLGDCGGIKDEGLVCLQTLPRLRRLDLEGLGLTDASLARIRPLKGLEGLSLRRNGHVTDAGLGHLKGLHCLRSLDLYGTQVTGTGLSALKGLPRLEHIALRYGGADGPGFGDADLASWPSLRSVDMGDLSSQEARRVRLPEGLRRLRLPMEVDSGTGPPQIPKSVQSVALYLWDTNAIELKFLDSLPDLRDLGLETRIDSAVRAIDGLKTLRALTLTGCAEVMSLEGMKHIAKLHQLESLEIGGVALPHSASAELRNLAGLRQLKLDELPDVADEGLAWLGDLKHLRVLNLGFGAGSIDKMLVYVQTLGDLEELAIYGALLTDTGLKKLKDLKHLRRLDLTGSHGFTDEGLRELMEALPALQQVKYSYRPH